MHCIVGPIVNILPCDSSLRSYQACIITCTLLQISGVSTFYIAPAPLFSKVGPVLKLVIADLWLVHLWHSFMAVRIMHTPPCPFHLHHSQVFQEIFSSFASSIVFFCVGMYCPNSDIGHQHETHTTVSTPRRLKSKRYDQAAQNAWRKQRV